MKAQSNSPIVRYSDRTSQFERVSRKKNKIENPKPRHKTLWMDFLLANSPELRCNKQNDNNNG